jgi:hypothetical protein
MKVVSVKSLVLITFVAIFGVAGLPPAASAQTASSIAPTIIPVSGQFTATGQARTVTLIVSLYEGQADVAPRWTESQGSVVVDADGRFSVQFGSTFETGLPADLFTGDPATKWIGVKILEDNATPEQRVMMVSVPFAAKAASADTLAGKPASEFVLSSTFREDVRAVIEDSGSGSGSGTISAAATAGNIAKFAADNVSLENSVMVEANGNVGIGVTPAAGTARLQVLNSSNNTGFSFTQAAANEAGFIVNMNGGASPAPAIQVYQGSNPLFIARTDGKVAIGTAAPTEGTRLDVAGTVAVGSGTASGLALASRSDTNTGLYFGGADDLYLVSGGTTRLAIANGNVGIGVTPGAGAPRLQVVNSGNNTGMTFTQNAVGEVGLAVNIAASSTAPAFQIYQASNPLFIARADGRVGIGTASPTAKLHVTGDVVVDGNIGAKYQDVAEWVDAREPLEAGVLVVIDTAATNRVTAATKAYDQRVAGAVSAQPGLKLGEPGEGKVLVAQSGRVRVKADATFGAIRPGDLLVSSPTRGHVMRSRPVKMGTTPAHRPGTIIGKALEALPSGKGDILVLLTLQ